MPSWIGVPELIVILIIVLVIFGPKRLPEIGRSMGKGIREFKKSAGELHERIDGDDTATAGKTDSAAEKHDTSSAAETPPTGKTP